MFIHLYKYDPNFLFDKLNYNSDTEEFSFVYQGICFVSGPCAELLQKEGHLSFFGITLGKIDIAENDFANNLACSMSREFCCYVEVRCSQKEWKDLVFAYAGGIPVKVPSLDRTLLSQIYKHADMQSDFSR